MALSNILSVVEDYLDSWSVSYGDSILIGAEYVHRQDTPPRIIAIPRGGPGRPVVHGGANPRPVWTRSLEVEFHCWGADFDGADSLLNSLISAIHAAAKSSATFGAEEWPELNSELLALGRVVIVRVTFLIPVTRPTSGTATVESVTQSTVLDAD